MTAMAFRVIADTMTRRVLSKNGHRLKRFEPLLVNAARGKPETAAGIRRFWHMQSGLSRCWSSVAAVIVATILVALIFRGSVIVCDGLVAAKEVRWPLQVRGPLPSPDVLPSIPPARSWYI
jgi:hypothetical protein